MDNIFKTPFYAKLALIFIGIFAMVFTMYIGQTIIVPIVYAIIIAILLNPIVNYLIGKKINKIIAISNKDCKAGWTDHLKIGLADLINKGKGAPV